MIWLQKTRESFAAPEESASLVSIQDLASTFPQKNSGVSSGCAEVKLEQLFSVQRIPVLVSKDFRIPSFAFPPWGLQLDLRRCPSSDAETLSSFWCCWYHKHFFPPWEQGISSSACVNVSLSHISWEKQHQNVNC